MLVQVSVRFLCKKSEFAQEIGEIRKKYVFFSIEVIEKKQLNFLQNFPTELLKAIQHTIRMMDLRNYFIVLFAVILHKSPNVIITTSPLRGGMRKPMRALLSSVVSLRCGS